MVYATKVQRPDVVHLHSWPSNTLGHAVHAQGLPCQHPGVALLEPAPTDTGHGMCGGL
jgi:hypothetical protein